MEKELSETGTPTRLSRLVPLPTALPGMSPPQLEQTDFHGPRWFLSSSNALSRRGRKEEEEDMRLKAAQKREEPLVRSSGWALAPPNLLPLGQGLFNVGGGSGVSRCLDEEFCSIRAQYVIFGKQWYACSSRSLRDEGAEQNCSGVSCAERLA